MIDTLTPEQEADIQPTIDAWLKNASEPTDREAATQVIYDIYEKYGHNQPHVVFASSPLVAAILHHIWDDFWKRFLVSINSASLNASLNASLRDSLNASLNASLRASLRDSLNASLNASLRASLRDSLNASLNASLNDSLNASLNDSLRDSLNAILYTLWWHWWHGGYGIVDFARRNLSLFQDNKDADLWIRLGKNIQILLPGTNVVIIVEKPTQIHFSETMTPKVLDYDHGASVEYSDGFKIYNLRGVMLSEENYNLITSQKLTATDITKLSADGKLNADQAAVAWQFLGTDNLLKGMDAKLVATGTKHKTTLERLGEDKCREKYLWAFRPETELYQVDNFMDTGRTEYCIKMWHPSIEDKTYVEWVEPSVGEKRNADLAQAAAFSIEKRDYMEAYEA